MVDLGSLVLLMSILGWKVAVLYVIFGLVIAAAGRVLKSNEVVVLMHKLGV